MKFKLIKATVVSFALLVSSFANAGLIKTIEIESAVNNWLQISEVIAWYGGSDLALLATATVSASDFYQTNKSCSSNTSNANCVIDGIGPEAWTNIYHGGSNSGSSILTITLNTASAISWIEVLGRSGCSGCNGRDIYNIRMFDGNGALVMSISDANADNSRHSTGRIAVPEPSTLAIFALGVIGLASRRMKKKA